MAMTSISYKRTQSLLLVERLLSLREGASPFNLIIDSLEQSARPLVKEYMLRAHLSKVSIIYISYETLRPPQCVTHCVNARRKAFTTVLEEAVNFLKKAQRSLVVLDSLQPLFTLKLPLPALLAPFMTPTCSLLATCHSPLPADMHSSAGMPYAASSTTILTYLATTVVHLHSFPQILARRRAAEMSMAEPVFGLPEEKDGLVIGEGANSKGGILVEMEHRRKSGRAVGVSFVLKTRPVSQVEHEGNIVLIDQHPAFRKNTDDAVPDQPDHAGGTFNLGLTERQKQAREGVVLPYFDAQGGGGEGGRILYEMGREDDFDEEEDEI